MFATARQAVVTPIKPVNTANASTNSGGAVGSRPGERPEVWAAGAVLGLCGLLVVTGYLQVKLGK